MGYKLNIRSGVSWVNLLRDDNIEITDISGNFTSGVLDGVLDELHTNKLSTTGKAADSDKLDGIDSDGYMKLGTSTVPNDYGMISRSSDSGTATMYINQYGSAEDIARFIKGDTSSSTSSSTSVTITSSGGIVATGSIYASSKSFLIDHPTKPDKKLCHGSLEGPENGVYVRGKLIDDNVIELPEYWRKLVDIDSITVNITPIGESQNLFVRVITESVIIIGSDSPKPINCFYMVNAERIDIDKLEVEQ